MEDLELAQELLNAKKNVVAEIQKVIIGQDEVIEDLLVALFSKGHCLFVGVPGLAKTLLVSTLSKVLNLELAAYNSHLILCHPISLEQISSTRILHLEKDHSSSLRDLYFPI